MTKDEFYDEVTDLDELVSFCERYNCYYIVEDLRRSDDFDSWIWDQLEDLRSRWYWYDLRGALNEIEEPSGDYFIPGDELEYSEPGRSDLDEYMDRVIEWGDENGFWDEEDDDDDEDWVFEEDQPEEDGFQAATTAEFAAFIGVA